MIKATIRGGFKDNTDGVVDSMVDQLGKMYYDRLIFNIRTNRFGYQLKDRTVKTKMYKNRSALPLIDSGAYLNQIRFEGGKVFVQDGIHPETGYDFKELAYILEYGRKDKSFFGFPVWRDTYNELKPEMEKFAAAYLSKNIMDTKKVAK